MVQSSGIMSTIVPMEGQSSNHLEMSEGVLYSLFFFRWAKRHWAFTGTHVIVLSLLDAKFLLHLSDIGEMDFESIFLSDIRLYIVIGSFSWLEVELVYIQFDAYMAVDTSPT